MICCIKLPRTFNKEVRGLKGLFTTICFHWPLFLKIIFTTQFDYAAVLLLCAINKKNN